MTADNPAPGADGGAQVALVTGASSGIGRAFALQLAERGNDLVVVARRREHLEELAADVADRYGRHVEVLAADLTDDAGLHAVEARLADPQRSVDLLVNNAGFGTQGRFWTLPVEREEQEITLNVVAVVRLTRAVLPSMVERRRGGVINVSSLAGLQSLPLWATYAASKAFVNSFTRSLQEELRGTGVRLLVVMPGFTRTEFQDGAGFSRSIVPGPAWMSAEAVARAALQAFSRGRAECVPGLRYQLLALSSRLSPWAVTRRVIRTATRNL